MATEIDKKELAISAFYQLVADICTLVIQGKRNLEEVVDYLQRIVDDPTYKEAEWPSGRKMIYGLSPEMEIKDFECAAVKFMAWMNGGGP